QRAGIPSRNSSGKLESDASSNPRARNPFHVNATDATVSSDRRCQRPLSPTAPSAVRLRAKRGPGLALETKETHIARSTPARASPRSTEYRRTQAFRNLRVADTSSDEATISSTPVDKGRQSTAL